MIKILLIGLCTLVLAGLFAVGALSVYAPKLLSAASDPRGWHRHPLSGPRPTGRPIEEIAADLRRALADHDRIVRTKSQWYVVHDLRVCERELHDLVEEASAELDLGPCPAALGGWTTVHLGVRLRELAAAGFTLPDHIALNGERF